MEHGYTNSTFGDGSLVVKCYEGPEAQSRLMTENSFLRRLHGKLPVPTVHHTTETSLTTCFVPGAHGQELLDEGRGREVLAECGRTLALIHALETDDDGRVLVHGDYGPNNLLLDPATFETVAILDWEWAHMGDPIEDLAWCEWIVRAHHPEHVAALPAFYDAYGGPVPTWAARQEAMLTRCQALLAFSGRPLWRQRLAATTAWQE